VRLLTPALRSFSFPEHHAYVVAAGKAAWPMARALAHLEPSIAGRGMIAGPVIGTATDEVPAGFEHFDAGHPSPNAASVAAGARALELARAAKADADTVLLVLLSGGASAMLAAPADGVAIEDKIAAARALMNAGVAIGGLNCVRKHLSAIKGGQLAAAARRTVTLAISDVHTPVPDDPSVIGSGLTVPDPTTFAEAQRIAAGVPVPERVRARLARGADGWLPETPKPGDPRFAENVYEIIGNRVTALEGARRMADIREFPGERHAAKPRVGLARTDGRSLGPVEIFFRAPGEVREPLPLEQRHKVRNRAGERVPFRLPEGSITIDAVEHRKEALDP
jgi:hydroxypyruvate reductase